MKVKSSCSAFLSMILLRKSIVIATLCGFGVSSVSSQALPATGHVGVDGQDGLSITSPHGTNPITQSSPVSVAPTRVLNDTVLALTVSRFTFSGNAAISSKELTSLIQDRLNQKLSLDDLDQIADRISNYYRAKGYTVARAYVPPQTFGDGMIRIAVIEGHFDQVNLKNSSQIDLNRLTLTTLVNLCGDASGCQGSIVQDAGLERSVLILKDLPGTAVSASIKPGTAVGTTDLEVNVSSHLPQAYSIGLDNYGNSVTGKLRFNASADIHNLRGGGDSLSLGVATTLKGSNTGSVSYSLPIGYKGARLGVAFARGQYRLGASYDKTDSHGTSNSLSVFGSYPVLRSVNRSFYVRGTAELRSMNDSVDVESTYFRKNASVLRAGFNGDNVDSWGGGGYTVYGATLSGGVMSTNDAADLRAAKIGGKFNKLAYNMGRQQAIAGPITLYGSINGQVVGNRNLDGSEQFGIGGPGAVRGYVGEAGGTEGIVGSLELRHTQPIRLSEDSDPVNFTSAVFIDRGWINAFKDTSGVAAYTRALGGFGVSLTAQVNGLYVRAVYAGHSASAPSVVKPGSTSNFWLQASLNY